MHVRGDMRMTNKKKEIIYKIVLISLIILSVVSIFIGYSNINIWGEETTTTNSETESDTDSGYSVFEDLNELRTEEFIDLIDNGDVESVARDSSMLYAKISDGTVVKVNDITGNIVSYLKVCGIEPETIKVKTEGDAITESESTYNKRKGHWKSLGMMSLIATVIAFSLYASHMKTTKEDRTAVVSLGGVSQRSDGTDKSVPDVHFSDVQGIDEIKADVLRIVDCLKNPDKYEALGARIPKGIILYGPPGTGKTLLAKAIAGEAGIKFYAASGSDFIEKYVGVGAKRVRELYSLARKNAPCIVFIDEVDAVAGARDKDSGSESIQTINALIAELDGFNTESGVFTICATNRLEDLDSAFMRSGRFDLKLAVGLPDKESRINILKLHTKNKKLADNIRINDLATRTVGFSGADLEALMNEAAMLAAEREHSCINQDDVDDAFFSTVMQGSKKKSKRDNKMTELVAWHESGHTLATKLMTEDSVTSVTIIGSSSGAGGVTFRVPKSEGLQSKKYLRATIGIMYAGRAAEEIYTGSDEEITTGASQDIKQATNIIKQYLAIYGMGDKGMLDITQLRTDFKDIMDEASSLAKDIYSDVLTLLKNNKSTLESLASALLDKETLDEQEIDKIIKG